MVDHNEGDYALPPLDQSPWPFSRPELMAGLRRYLDAPSLRLLEIDPMPLPSIQPGERTGPRSKLRAISVGVEIDGATRHLALVVKEAPVSQRGRVLHMVGRREHGVYTLLAPHLPLLVPALVAGDPAKGWIVVEALGGLRPPEEWTREDYVDAITNLAALHDRFWRLDQDLAIYGWLGRPFEADYEATVTAAAEAVGILVRQEHIPALSTQAALLAFGSLVVNADTIARPLREESFTLLHGEYWPGNIARPLSGRRQIVFDWQLAGIGPAIVDLVAFIKTTDLMLSPPLPLDEAAYLYRAEMTRRVDSNWDDERFALLWDHALLWLFLANWLGRLATMTLEDYDMLPPGFERVWLYPVLETLQRRLGVTLPAL